MELVQVGERTYYIKNAANIGVYRIDDRNVYLIDAGNDKDAGKKADKHIKENGWTLKMIINTHSNADHIGGNKVLADRWGCPVYAKGIEAAFTEFPQLEPSFLFGAYPPKALRNKSLMAQMSAAADIMKKDGSAVSDPGAPRIISEKELADDFKTQLPAGMEFINLPGHFFDMIGVKTPDDIWFMADCVSSGAIIEKYHISFIYDIRRYLQTLNFIETLKGELFIPAHTETSENMAALADVNRRKVHEICELICELCRRPVNFEKLLSELFSHYGLVMDFNQYVLVGSTVKSYLAYLTDEGRMETFFEDNMLKWKGGGV